MECLPVFRKAAYFALAILSAASTIPANAGELTPVGTWQTKGGESRYEVSYCGGGDQLCARLTWLAPSARSKENLAYLNKYIVKEARPTGANTWRGTVRYQGQTIGGRMRLVSPNTLKLNGCKLIFCKTLEFKRV